MGLGIVGVRVEVGHLLSAVVVGVEITTLHIWPNMDIGWQRSPAYFHPSVFVN
jgi:hypothetical protein